MRRSGAFEALRAVWFEMRSGPGSPSKRILAILGVILEEHEHLLGRMPAEARHSRPQEQLALLGHRQQLP